MAGGRFLVNENASQIDLPGAHGDELPQPVRPLPRASIPSTAWPTRAKQSRACPATSKAQYAKTFARGLDRGQQLRQRPQPRPDPRVEVTLGSVSSPAQDRRPAQPAGNQVQHQGLLYTGTSTDPVDGLPGRRRLQHRHQEGRGDHPVVPIDLSEMGTQTRSMANVVSYLNGKLADAGAFTRFATDRIPAPPRRSSPGQDTSTVHPAAGGRSAVGASDVQDHAFARTGDPVGGPDQRPPSMSPSRRARHQSTATLPLGSTPADKKAGKAMRQRRGQSAGQVPDRRNGRRRNSPASSNSTTSPGRVLPPTPHLRRQACGDRPAPSATATGADGSVYLLANVTAATDGQAIQGAQDVALQKYDSAGNLVYSRDLGAGVSASGMALSVSSTGQVAIGGAVTGSLNPKLPSDTAVYGVVNPGETAADAVTYRQLRQPL